MSEYRWMDIEELYDQGRWAQFVRACQQEIDSGWKEQPEWWTMLAFAYDKLSNPSEALRCLETGVARHPKAAVCHAFYGTRLAEESAGKPEMRAKAIRHWRVALELERKEGYSTFNDLQQEIEVLSALKRTEVYPPVSDRVRSYVGKLKAAGLFSDLGVDAVLAMAGQEVGQSLLTAKGKALETFVQLDSTRHLDCDWRFSALNLLKQAAKMLAGDGLTLKTLSETKPDEKGRRKARFVVGSKTLSCDGILADEFLLCLNEILAEIGIPKRFFRMRRSNEDDGYEFLLLTKQEARELRTKKLVDIGPLRTS